MLMCSTEELAGLQPARVVGWSGNRTQLGFARHVNVHVVFVHRVIHQVAREEGAGPQ
jgi:hypothetical protein